MNDIYAKKPADLASEFSRALEHVKNVRDYLVKKFIGANMKENIEMLLACAIAQEPVLFIGGPGLAKTELAIAFFESIGLRKPTVDTSNDGNKYYEYLLSAFTLPEELFGPYKVGEGGLKSGKFIRENKNMLTGPGIRGCFLDEVFKGSSNILNTLLSLINERRYFNDGMFHQSELSIILGASNTTPLSESSTGGMQLPGKGSSSLLAFYDRFTVRLYFKDPSTSTPQNIKESDYYRIREASILRESAKLDTGKPFVFDKKADIEDFILLSRLLLYSGPNAIFAPPSENWVERFLSIGMLLAQNETCPVRINPRKMTRLEKIARAYALIDNLDSGSQERPIQLKRNHCLVFKHAWENEMLSDQLSREVEKSLWWIPDA
jgi:MoxR-like ATPase